MTPVRPDCDPSVVRPTPAPHVTALELVLTVLLCCVLGLVAVRLATDEARPAVASARAADSGSAP